MSYVLLDNRVLIKREKNPDKIGSIYIPASATTKPDPEKGVVVAIGPGKALARLSSPEQESGSLRVPMQVAVGDVVLYNRFVAIQIDEKNDPDLLVMHETDVFCILSENEE
jgi:co-chaperonin GroES (HSP10)